MIELFDAERLLPRRSWGAPLAAAALMLATAAMGAYGWSLHGRVLALERQRAELQQRLQAARDPAAPSEALLADLQREAERLEAEAGDDPQAVAGAGPAPSQWMLRLAEMGSAQVSLSRIEVDRGGAVRIEGVALSPQSVNALVQTWDRLQPPSRPVAARSLEVREDDAGTPTLRFRLLASAPAAQVRP